MSIWHNGSSRKLLGRNLILAIFISEAAESWSKPHKRITCRAAHDAVRWLQEQAQPYEAHFEAEWVFFNAETADVQVDSYGDFAQNPDAIAHAFGYADIRDLYQNYQRDYPEYNIFLLYLANSHNEAGHYSYASAHGIEVDGQALDLEFCTLFRDMRNDGQISTMTLAHEFLHMYGAPDLYAYDEAPATVRAQSQAIAHAPHDLMLCHEEPFEVSEFTAFAVGWHENPQAWYLEMCPPSSLENFTWLVHFSGYLREDGTPEESYFEQIQAFIYEKGRLSVFRAYDNEALIYWKFDETQEDGSPWLEYLLPLREDAHTFEIACASAGIHLRIPRAGGRVRQKIDAHWQDWYEVSPA